MTTEGPGSPVEVKTPFGGLRSWRAEDAPAVTALANDRRIARNLRDAFPHPYTLDDAHTFLAAAAARVPDSFLAIEVAGEVAGGIGYTMRSDVERIGAEVGYWLGVRFWGRGIATSAVRALSRHVFDVHSDLQRLYALPFSWNPASARVLEKAGYRKEGTLRRSAIKEGQVLDQWMYALLRDELTAWEER
jgi:RimJ/RimL family protein N-acetyltransferase